MLIDWFTVGAQIVNFLILVWLLKHFLYQPILLAIDTRERHVASVLAEADKKHNQALSERADYAYKNEQFDQAREQMLINAKAAVEAQRTTLISDAQNAAKVLREKYQKSLIKEGDELKQLLSKKTMDEVFAISRQALQSLASKSLETQILDVFIAQIKGLDSKARAELTSALQDDSNHSNNNSPSNNSLMLRSAFDLSKTQCNAVQTAIQQIAGKNVELAYIATDDHRNELIAGIEISAKGYKLAWSIDHYLRSMEQELASLLKENNKSIKSAKPMKSVPDNANSNE